MTDLVIPQGALLEHSAGLRDKATQTMIPLTLANDGPRDLKARMQIRRKPGAIAEGDLWLSLSSDQPTVAGSGLWLDQTPGGEPKIGFVWIRLAPDDNATLVRNGWWDVEVYDPLDPVFVLRLDGGQALVSKQVTLP